MRELSHTCCCNFHRQFEWNKFWFPNLNWPRRGFRCSYFPSSGFWGLNTFQEVVRSQSFPITSTNKVRLIDFTTPGAPRSTSRVYLPGNRFQAKSFTKSGCWCELKGKTSWWVRVLTDPSTRNRFLKLAWYRGPPINKTRPTQNVDKTTPLI